MFVTLFDGHRQVRRASSIKASADARRRNSGGRIYPKGIALAMPWDFLAGTPVPAEEFLLRFV